MSKSSTSITTTAASQFLSQAKPSQELHCSKIKGFHLRKNKDSGSWRLSYQDAAKKRRRYTLADYSEMKPQEAAEAAIEWRAAMKRGDSDPLTAKVEKAAEIELQKAEEANRVHLKVGSYFAIYENVISDSPDVLRKIKSEFRHLFDRDMDGLNASDITAWYHAKRKDGLKRSTLVGYFGAFKAMLNHAAGIKKGTNTDNPILKTNPLSGYTLPSKTKAEQQAAASEQEEQSAQRDIFSNEIIQGIEKGLSQYDELIRGQRRNSIKHGKQNLAALDSVNYPHWFFAFCEIARLTGMRPSDIYSLRWSNLHYNELQKTTTLIFTPKKTQHKGDNPITVKFPVSSELKDVFDKWRDDSGNLKTGLLFKSERTGREIERKAHLKHWAHVKRLGGLPDELQFYSFRHNFISQLVQRNVALIKIAKLVGHADTTMIVKNYLRMDEEDMLDVAALASDGWKKSEAKKEKIA